MARNAAGKRKLEEQLLQPCLILADVGIYLAIGAFEVCVAYDGRATVPWTGYVNHVEIELFDYAVQVHVNEVLAGCCSPMPQQHVLDILKH